MGFIGFSPAAWWTLDQTFGRWMDRRVSRVLTEVPAPAALPLGPILMVSNHTSFWDGFLLRRVQKALRPEAPLYTVMLQEELARRPLLQKLGGMGIHPGDPVSMRRLVSELRNRLAAAPDAVVGFFPQGRIWPSFRRPLGFRRGVAVLLRHLPQLTVLPVGIHLEGHNRVDLSAYVSVGGPLTTSGLAQARREDPELVFRLESAVESRLDRIHDHLNTFGEDAMLHWPPLENDEQHAPGDLSRGTHGRHTEGAVPQAALNLQERSGK